MGYQSLADIGQMLRCAQYNMMPDCICERVHCARRLRRLGIGVYADFAEVMAKARLKKGACLLIQRPAWRVQSFVYDVRRGSRSAGTDGFPLQLLFLAR